MGRNTVSKTRVHDIDIHMEYFLRHQVPAADSDCIEWDAGMHRQGYGMCGAWRVVDGKKIMSTVHRIAARIHFDRAIDSSEMVIHTCSNMKCCNPEHLMIGDRYDIHRVMTKNKRHRPRGKNIYKDK